MGTLEDPEMYLQESGRARRDGAPAQAILVQHTHDSKFASKQMLEYIKNTSQCRRSMLLRDFLGCTEVSGKSSMCCDDVSECVPVISASKSKLLYKLHNLILIVRE